MNLFDILVLVMSQKPNTVWFNWFVHLSEGFIQNLGEKSWFV